MPSGSSSLILPGIRGDNSLLNQGFLQAKPEKLAAAQKPRGHLPASAPAPVSAVRTGGTSLGDLPCCPLTAGPLHRLLLLTGFLTHLGFSSQSRCYSLGEPSSGKPATQVPFSRQGSHSFWYLVLSTWLPLRVEAALVAPCVHICMCESLLPTCML